MNNNLNLPDNYFLEFNSEGCFMKVALAIPKELVKLIGNPNNVFLSNKNNTYYYQLKKQITNVNKKTIEDTYSYLLNNLQTNIREKKIQQLEKEILTLNKQLKLNL
jgi:hypothetical protein